MTRIDLLHSRLTRLYQQALSTKSQQLDSLLNRLRLFHPQRQMQALEQRLLFSENRLQSIQKNYLLNQDGQLQLQVEKLKQHNPQIRLPVLSTRVEGFLHQLHMSMQACLLQQQHDFSLQARSLDNLSPLKTLSRGYSAISKQGQVISSTRQLAADDDIEIRLKDGEKQARIL